MKVISPILPQIGCHGNVSWGIKKLGQIDNIHINTFGEKKSWKSVQWILRALLDLKKERNYGR